jgi:hypothetical protein
LSRPEFRTKNESTIRSRLLKIISPTQVLFFSGSFREMIFVICSGTEGVNHPSLKPNSCHTSIEKSGSPGQGLLDETSAQLHEYKAPNCFLHPKKMPFSRGFNQQQ